MTKPVSYFPSDDPAARFLSARPEPLLIRPQETALIIVDMQNAYASPGGYLDLAGFDISGAAPAIERIAEAAAAARAAGMQVIFFQNGWDADYVEAGGPGSPNWHKSNAMKTMRQRPELKGKLLAKGGWDYELVEALPPQPGDIVVQKPRYSAFYNTNLDSILRARTGALIIIGDTDELSFLYSGGIKLDIDYSPAFLYQVAKMDGAICLSANATKLSMCNVQLMPDPTILSLETGTRHRTAERVSKQTDALVIAVSARRDVVSLYVDGAKYILEDIPTVLAKANQALATLDKYRARLDQVSTRLTALEFEGGATLHDVLTVLQRSELVTRMAVEIERYIVELGTEGRLIEMQLEETMVGTAADKAALVRDYLVVDGEEAFAQALDLLGRLPHQDLLDFGRLAEMLGYDRKLNTLDYPVSPRGYRVLGRIPRLPKIAVASIVQAIGGLDQLLAAGDGELEGIEGVGELRAKDIREGLRRLQEINLVDRYLQT